VKLHERTDPLQGHLTIIFKK